MADFSGLEHIVRENEPLSPYGWLRTGGVARYFSEPTTEEELVTLVMLCKAQGITVKLLGSGSNILVASEIVDAMIVHLSAAAFSEITVTDNYVTAKGGAKLVQLLSTAAREGLSGLESLAGIPGTVAGALKTNAGTHNDDIGQWTQAVKVLTREGEVAVREGDELRFAYRESSLNELVILEGTFALKSMDPVEVTKRTQTQWILTKTRQPRGGAGTICMFRDHGGVTAESLIESAGLKGIEMGAASLNDSCLNYLELKEGGSVDNAVVLLKHVQATVEAQTGVALIRQVEVW
ncbi:MAG: UDP-N-acetylenolpyruvoylglucosamine reductase [Planctomycetaceae bacterium]|nr:UDP-N-acetylenolpyruvoylglucosamine reductase [Planctomycetaceae bacterium]